MDEEASWGYGSSPSSDTIVNYSGSGLHQYLTLFVIGDFDSHRSVDTCFVGWVGSGENVGDVLQRCNQRFDFSFAKPCGGVVAERGL